MSYSHEDFQRNFLDRVHQIRVANMLPTSAADNILTKVPPDILEHNELVNFVKTNIGINDDNLIQQAIDILVNRKDLVMVEQKGLTFCKKLDLGNNNKTPIQNQNQNQQSQQNQNQRFR